MINPKQLITENLKQILLELSDQDITPEISILENSRFGDFTTNIALLAFKRIPTDRNGVYVRNIPVRAGSAKEMAETIKSLYEDVGDENIKKVEVAGPGFINFYLSDKYLSDNLSLIDSGKDNYGHSNVLENVRTIVEFGDPNPFKQIHIGHLRNFCIGESFSRLLGAQGADVIRVNYQGDVGMHVAKSLWAILQNQKPIRQPADKDQNLTAEDLANAYAYGATEYEKHEETKKKIERLNKLIYEEDKEIRDLWEKGRKISLDNFEKLYRRINIHYDKYYLESLAAKRGREIVLNNVENGIFERDEGAIIYRGEKEGLHTRVFLTSEDYATYEAKDLALAVMKDEDLHYDESIILTGNEQAEYFQVMLAALKKITPELADKTRHLTFGHVRLKDGKMSSRTGDVITAEWL